MQEQTRAAALRAAIEEELGNFRHFAHLPATEIEDMAARILRVVAHVGQGAAMPDTRAA